MSDISCSFHKGEEETTAPLPSYRKPPVAGCAAVLVVSLLGALAVGCIWACVELRKSGDEGQEKVAREPTPSPIAPDLSSPRNLPHTRRAATENERPQESLPYVSHKRSKQKSKEEVIEMPASERQRLRKLIADLISKRPKPEPIKPELYTETEFQIAKIQSGAVRLRSWDLSPVTAVQVYENLYRLLDKTRAIMPRTVQVLEREALKQVFDARWSEKVLDNQINFCPGLRLLKGHELQSVLRSRAAWKERRDLFDQLRAVTGDERGWSLLHVFDDLDRDSMLRVIEVAKKGRERGCGGLSQEERHLLTISDQLEFLDELLLPSEERRAKEETREQQRGEAEEYRERMRKIKEKDRKVEEARERERQQREQEQAKQKQKIDEVDKKAQKLLRPALQLEARGGFDKQVRERLREIIEKYPDTPSAKKARHLLEKKSGASSDAR